MVQEVGGGDKESRITVADALVGDGCCQVCFTTAACSNQNQPAPRASGKCFGGLIGVLKLLLTYSIAASTFRYRVIKG